MLRRRSSGSFSKRTVSTQLLNGIEKTFGNLSNAQMDALNLHPDAERPRWNYEIRPHATDRSAPAAAAAAGETAGISAEPAPATA